MRAAVGSLIALWLVACGDSVPLSAAGSGGDRGPGVDRVVQSRLAQCVLHSPMLEVGKGLDAPGRIEVDVAAGQQSAGPCQGNTLFRFGSGIYDATGVVGNTSSMGYEYPLAILSGIHTRQHARAFAIESPCNGKRVMFVSTDVGMIWPAVRYAVVAALAEDPELSAAYAAENVMLSATHTHSGPAGFSHDIGGNLFHFGFDADTFQAIVDGILGAIRLAHANLEAHPQTAPIGLAVGELLDTNINRSLAAFVLDPEEERREFLDARGEQIDNDKRVVQLNLVRDDGAAVGIINWFGVHTTSIGTTNSWVSSDNKGFASLGFERIAGTDYLASPGEDTFVAAFAQTDEGDSSPNIFILERPFPDPTRGGGRDEYESNAISGTKHLAKALELFAQGRPVSGPVDYRYFNVPIDQIEITDPVTLASLRHPPELDADPKRTCSGAVGPSFGGGAEDGTGPGEEGVSCSSSPDVIEAARHDFNTLLNERIPPTSPYDTDIPSHIAANAVFCNFDRPTPFGDFTCQAEKPVFLPQSPTPLPFQLFRVGNLAIIGLPWEITTMSARRIRKTLLEVLAPVGIDTVIIAGLSNAFVQYLTTREEFSSQQYEGASTLYGPWTLAAVQQESRKLALAMAADEPAPEGPPIADEVPRLVRPPYVPSDLPGLGTNFGDLLVDVPNIVERGDTVRAEWQAGHPRNDRKTQSSYVYAERQLADGSWQAVATDRDPELVFDWSPTIPPLLPLDTITGSSTAAAVWTVPRDLPAGVYRLRHDGAARMSLLAAAAPYSGVSSSFAIEGEAGPCP
jgi:neutral ceramidase